MNPRLLRAYRATRYEAAGHAVFIGRRAAAIDALLRRYGVRAGVFLKTMNDFAEMNAVYGKYFSSAPPARSTVEVSRLPKDVLVAIDVIALS